MLFTLNFKVIRGSKEQWYTKQSCRALVSHSVMVELEQV